MLNLLNMGQKRSLPLYYSYKTLKVLSKFSGFFVIRLSLSVIRNSRGTCWSVKMLKWYMVRERLATPGLGQRDSLVPRTNLNSRTLLFRKNQTQMLEQLVCSVGKQWPPQTQYLEEALAQLENFPLSVGRLSGRSTSPEWITVALLGQERSPQPPRQEANFRL